MTVDPLEHAMRLLRQAQDDHAALRKECDSLRLEAHQLRRRIERWEGQYRDLDERYARLEQEAEAAGQRADMSRRAMLDHAART